MKCMGLTSHSRQSGGEDIPHNIFIGSTSSPIIVPSIISSISLIMAKYVDSDASTLYDISPEIALSPPGEQDSYQPSSSQLHILSQLDNSYVGAASLLCAPLPLSAPSQDQAVMPDGSQERAAKRARDPVSALTAVMERLPDTASSPDVFRRITLQDMKALAAYIGIKGSVKWKLVGPVFEAIYKNGALDALTNRPFTATLPSERRGSPRGITPICPHVSEVSGAPAVADDPPSSAPTSQYSQCSGSDGNRVNMVIVQCPGSDGCGDGADSAASSLGPAGMIRRDDTNKWTITGSGALIEPSDTAAPPDLCALHDPGGLYVAATRSREWRDMGRVTLRGEEGKATDKTVLSMLEEFRNASIRPTSYKSRWAVPMSAATCRRPTPIETYTQPEYYSDCTGDNGDSNREFWPSTVAPYMGSDACTQATLHNSSSGREMLVSPGACTADTEAQYYCTPPQLLTPEFTQLVITHFGGSSSCPTPDEYKLSPLISPLPSVNPDPSDAIIIATMEECVDDHKAMQDEERVGDDAPTSEDISANNCIANVTQYCQNLSLQSLQGSAKVADVTTCAVAQPFRTDPVISHVPKYDDMGYIPTANCLDCRKEIALEAECGLEVFHAANANSRQLLLEQPTLDDFPVGSYQDVYCECNKVWYEAKILQHVPAITLDQINVDLVKVHFLGWNIKFDRTLDIATGVVQKHGTFTSSVAERRGAMKKAKKTNRKKKRRNH